MAYKSESIKASTTQNLLKRLNYFIERENFVIGEESQYLYCTQISYL